MGNSCLSKPEKGKQHAADNGKPQAGVKAPVTAAATATADTEPANGAAPHKPAATVNPAAASAVDAAMAAGGIGAATATAPAAPPSVQASTETPTAAASSPPATQAVPTPVAPPLESAAGAVHAATVPPAVPATTAATVNSSATTNDSPASPPLAAPATAAAAAAGTLAAVAPAQTDVTSASTDVTSASASGQGGDAPQSAMVPALSTRASTDMSKPLTDPERAAMLRATQELNLLRSRLTVVLAGVRSKATLPQSELVSHIKELSLLIDGDFKDRALTAKELEKAEEICNYMLRESIDDCITLWFGKSEETDAEIWSKYGEYVIHTSDGLMDHWTLDTERPRLLLAWVLMLDQFRRNMFRNSPAMYATDQKCQYMVKRALDAGMAEAMETKGRIFLCLVLTHSEDMDDQYRCVAEWAKVEKLLETDSPFHVFKDIFERHVAVVEKFGRFPHRNEILKRPSTPQELEFLADDSFRFDLPLKKHPDSGSYYFDRAAQRTVQYLGHTYTTTAGADDAMAATDPDRLRWDNPDKRMVAQDQIKNQSNLRIGDTAPNFTAHTTMGPLNFYDYVGDSWAILFSHPADFTPVCTTELGFVASMQDEGRWDRRNVKVMALSVDSLESHMRWIKDIESTQGCKFSYPLIDDHERRVSMLYGMLDQTLRKHGKDAGMTITVRSVFIISPEKRVELILSYPAPIGRDFNEIFRAMRALQMSRKFKVATPVNWRPGMDTVVLPFLSDEVAETAYKGGITRKATNYLRFVADPEMAMARDRAISYWKKLRLLINSAGRMRSLTARSDVSKMFTPDSFAPLGEMAEHTAQADLLDEVLGGLSVTQMVA